MRGSCVAKTDGAFNPCNIQNKIADPRKTDDYDRLSDRMTLARARPRTNADDPAVRRSAGGDLLPRGCVQTTPASWGMGIAGWSRKQSGVQVLTVGQMRH
jgi:hypothetical protein